MVEVHVIKFTELRPSRDECRLIVQSTLKSELGLGSVPKLQFDTKGKPYIKEKPELAFSYAHSSSQLVIAKDSNAQSIGVDTEPIQRQREIVEVANIGFSPEELAILENSEYIMAWCRKEAAVKRLGTGFRDADPSGFSVRTNQESYKLYLGGRKIHDGYFFNVVLGDDVIVVCTDKPTKDFSLYCHTLKDMQTKE